MILSSQELSEYFGKDKTPREMKDTILKLLGEWKSSRRSWPHRKRKTSSRKSNIGPTWPDVGGTASHSSTGRYIPRRRKDFSTDGIRQSRAKPP